MHADVLDTTSPRQQSIPARSKAALSHTVSFLDSTIPLRNASHRDVVRYSVETIWRKAECIATLADGSTTKLDDAWQFIGYTGRFLLFRSNDLHIEMQIDTEQPIIALETNSTRYLIRNWMESIKHTVTAMVTKTGGLRTRFLDRNRRYTAVDGSQVSLEGCSA